MRSRAEDDVFLFNAVRNVLNEEEQSLDMGIRSKLTQQRFNVIDNALPQQRMFNREVLSWGMGVAFSVLFAVLVTMNFTIFNADTSIAEKINLHDEDAESLEMYEWLYNNYG